MTPNANQNEREAKALWQKMSRVLPDFSLADAEEMIIQAAAREKVKVAYDKFFDDVAALLFHHDPENISYGRANTYELEAGTIIPRLQSYHSPEDVCRVVHEEFCIWFCGRVRPEDEFIKIANEIWELWQKYKRGLP
jgi:hypothetical protein